MFYQNSKACKLKKKKKKRHDLALQVNIFGAGNLIISQP
jgi:hypothetical protein